MNRLNTLMGLQLFTNSQYRLTLSRFIETDLYYNNLFENIDHLVHAIYDEKSNIERKIEDSILRSKLYVSFDHDTNDSILQRLIFYSIIFSFQKYPKEDDWNNYLNLPEDEKMDILFDGITLIASELLIKDLEKNLLSEFDNLTF